MPPPTPGSISSGCCKKRPPALPTKRFASGKTLMPGGFTPPEQIKVRDPWEIRDFLGVADKKEPAPAAPAAPDMGGMY